MGEVWVLSSAMGRTPHWDRRCWCPQHPAQGFCTARVQGRLKGAGTCVGKGLACRVAPQIQPQGPSPHPLPGQVPVRVGVLDHRCELTPARGP